MKKATRPTTITLVALAEVDDLRLICWNNDWMQSVVKVWKLNPGEGVLFINRAHNRLRAVVALDVPVLVIFPVDKANQNAVFTATVEALVGGKAIEIKSVPKRALARRDWALCTAQRDDARIKVAA